MCILSFFYYCNYNLLDMEMKVRTCVGNKAALDLYKKQDWWKSYIRNVLEQTYQSSDCSTIDQNSREVKRCKLGMLLCKSSTATLQNAFLWRNTVEGHNFWENKFQNMCSYGLFEESEKYIYTYPLKKLFFST